MANYNQVGYGSKGNDVTELQKLLNQNGYKLDTDGVFGSKTQAAVKDYQSKNNLSVDGIAGKNTWGALTKAQTTANNTSGSTTSTPTESTFKYDPYTESDTVKQAQAMLQEQMSQKPGAYQSAWQTQLNDVLNKILNREEFSYDLNGDMLYQQYKDQYINQGKMAMMDTMGQASALTGGYGNSYAQSVGQQAYQGYLQQLNDIVPDLYNLALSKYQSEGDDLYNQASLMSQMEGQDYDRYRDNVSDYYTELERLYNQYNTERDYDYSKWSADRNFAYGQFSDDRNYNYQTERDKIADQQWQAEFDEAKRQYDQSYALSAAKSYSSGSSGSDDTESADGAPDGWDIAKIMAFQKASGLEVTGEWDEDTQKVYIIRFGAYGTGGSTNGTTNTKKTTVASLEKELNNYVANGVPNYMIMSLLNSVYESGDITETEYKRLKGVFARGV